MKKHLILAASALLGLTLGLTSCGDDNEDPLPLVNDPKISFYVQGTVTDASGTPLEGITMSVKEDYMNFLGYVSLGSTETDDQGKYRSTVFTDATIHKGQVIIAEDPTGTYLNDTLELNTLTKQNVAPGDDARDSGTWELTADFVLKLRQ